MKCKLCENEIENYKPEFNRIEVDAGHAADICSACVDKILKQQGKKYAALFPTSAMKKRFGKGQK